MSHQHDHDLRAPEYLVRHSLRRAGVRALHADGSLIHASRGLELLRSEDGGDTFAPVARVRAGAFGRFAARTPLLARFLRTGFHGLVPMADGGHVAIVRGAILHRAPGAETFTVAHAVTRGTRPLNVCAAPSGRLYFGEYYSNGERGEVHVYGSDDGLSWDVAYTFAAGSIRHVHGIHADPYRGGLWVLTGDDDDESAVLWTDDDFRTLERVAHGSQRARAVAVLPTPDALVVPTDTPRETNLVQRMDLETGRLEPLCSLPGSVFSAARTERLYVLSTTVEKSDVNVDQRVALLASVDGDRWTCFARFHRDLPLLRDRRGYLQLPTLNLPAGRGAGRVLATGQALMEEHGALLGWDERAVERAVLASHAAPTAAPAQPPAAPLPSAAERLQPEPSR